MSEADQTARPARAAPSAPDIGEIAVAAPPPAPRPAAGVLLTRLVPAVLAVAMIGITAAVYRSGPTAARNPVLLIFPLIMLVSVTATALAGRNSHHGNDIDADRDDYLNYLAGLRESVTNTAAAQRATLLWRHPPPDALWTLVGGARIWQRRPGDPDFGRVRVGLGDAPPATRLIPPDGPAGRADPVTDTALRRFLRSHATVPELPVTVDLLDSGGVLPAGEPGQARGLLRAMICQLAIWHGPDVVRIAAAVSDRTARHWDWLKWLPHHQHPDATDGAGPARLTYPSLAAAETALAGQNQPRLLVVVDDGAGPGIVVAGADATARPRVTGTDRMDPIDALVCARRLAGYRLAAPAGAPGWPALAGLGDPASFDPNALWDNPDPGDRLRIPIGTDAAGAAVYLDIKEAADHGTGPHGLCIGATGSGKSEFLRTVVLGMLARHSPATLNLVLVDFKGGATFLGLQGANHVAAVITNLADQAPLVARMRDALAGELHRRQELLRTAGNFASATAYRDARRAGAPLPALPALLVIVDEFSELLSQHPDFVDMFVAIGRLGRSLGIHLLLASQRLDEGRLRGLESHLSYRVCLKTLSASESRIVLGVPDAHQLPNIPGRGYLRSADGDLTGFQAAFVSGPGPAGATDSAPPPAVRPFTAAPVGPIRGPASPAGGPTMLQAVLDRLAGHGSPARPVWLPPLDASPALADLLDDQPPLVVPIGVVDRPFEQRRTPLLVDLRGPAGHVAVVGAPRSGKSTALATLITALAATGHPDRVQIYGLDFGGGALTSLRSLPQVGSVAGRAEADLVRRTVAELEAILARREAARDAAGADVFLVIDGWAGLCREFEALEAPIVALAGRGLSFRMHVVVAAARWAEIRPGLRDLIGSRIELRLGDPADSEIDRRQAQQVPRDRPGRGLTDGGLHTLIALPQATLPDRGGATAPPVPLLPALVHRGDLIEAAGRRPLLGVDERGLRVVTLDFDRQPHLLIIGDNECGKTSVLRTCCAELVRTSTAERARLLLVDYRRGLLGAVDPDRLAGHAGSGAALSALLPELLGRLAGRMPGPEVTGRQLRDRSWWRGPQLYVLVDDYDLVATGAGNPLSPLLEYLPHATDLGLHLVVARRSGGAARAIYDPVLAALRDLGCMGLMMSGNPDEGPLLGSVRPAPLPPGRGTLVTRAGGEQLIQVAWSR